MKILGIDPGAERSGWAVLEDGPSLIDSGILRYPRNGVPFQQYRLALQRFAWLAFSDLLYDKDFTQVVVETIPPMGFNNSVQSYLANCVATTLHNVAFKLQVPVTQVSARTVQSKIGIKGRTGKVSKVGVRKGIAQLLPEHAVEISTLVADESDAVAIGCYGVMYLK